MPRPRLESWKSAGTISHDQIQMSAKFLSTGESLLGVKGAQAQQQGKLMQTSLALSTATRLKHYGDWPGASHDCWETTDRLLLASQTWKTLATLS